MEFAIWNLEFAIWNLRFGIWNTWNLEFGILNWNLDLILLRDWLKIAALWKTQKPLCGFQLLPDF
ncbi:MAG: hypothetical protein IPJ30_15015 [Acidobacteria bacterium]|nr:hypothetical protein [Acidobacteriota bacterium]